MNKNKLLIVVDMQNDFVTGTLANPAAKAIIPNIIKKLEKKDYSYLIFTRDTHQKDYLETQEGKNLPVEHCIEGTEGWEIVPELQKYAEKAIIVNKPSFGFNNWAAVMEEHFADENMFPEDFPTEIELVGTCTAICVASNATILKSIYPEMPISVDSACCACLNEDTHNAALAVMKTQQITVL